MVLPEIQQAGDLRGKHVLVRAALNVPVKNDVVADDFRLRNLFPTLEFLKKAGARIIVMGHIGREPKATLRPVFEELRRHMPLSFIESVVGPRADGAALALHDGDMLMLENLRQCAGERDNEEDFAEQLASLGDVYVNDAFPVSHREHASIVRLPKLLPSYVGFQFQKEVEELSEVLKPPEPSLFALGGIKFDTKRPLFEKFLDIYDHLFIGGALANDFFQARGFEIGRSIVSGKAQTLSDLCEHKKLVLPADVVVETKGGARDVRLPHEVNKDDIIRDAGPRTISQLETLVQKTASVVWNGPLGDYEDGFVEGTEGLAHTIANSQANFKVVGGGNTVAAIASLNLASKLTFISTGGGAMLQFLADETLPGIEVLQ